jgi:hypothetical protein
MAALVSVAPVPGQSTVTAEFFFGAGELIYGFVKYRKSHSRTNDLTK